MHPSSAVSLRATLVTLLFAVFSTMAFAQKLTVLHTFEAGDGVNPYSGLVHGSDGYLYGTAFIGGTGCGTVFRISTSGKFKSIYSFGGFPDGCGPLSSVIRDSAGNLYGTTWEGGPSNAGTVFKITAAGRESILYAFTGGADGLTPVSDLVRDSKGNLYGTTERGGNLNCGYAAGCGVVFKIDTTGKETVIHTFEAEGDGALPFAGLVMDSSGSLYGTVSNDGLYGFGQVFKIANGEKTSVHDFQPSIDSDGAYPETDLAFAPGGILYGTATQGGVGYGAVFKIDTSDIETIVHSFEGSDGDLPSGPLARDTAGNLYGVTSDGGANALGAAYKMDASGNLTILHSFTGGTDGREPSGRLYVSSNGTVYGTTTNGGCCGVVFKITP